MIQQKGIFLWLQDPVFLMTRTYKLNYLQQELRAFRGVGISGVQDKGSPQFLTWSESAMPSAQVVPPYSFNA